MNDDLINSLESVECVGSPIGTADAPHLHVVGIIDPRMCAETEHVRGLVLSDETRLSDVNAIALIDAGRVLYMLPPPGAPAHAASQALGAPLLLQVRTCEHCNTRVLFA